MPDLLRYIASLPRIGVIAPAAGAPSIELPGIKLYETRVGPLVARRLCAGDRGHLSLSTVDAPLPPQLTPDPRQVAVGCREALVLRRDTRHDWWIVGDGQFAFRGSDLAPVDVSAIELSDELALPLGWVLGGAASLLVAALLLLARRSTERRITVLAGATAGMYEQCGRVMVDDDLPILEAAPLPSVPSGPVLVIVAEDDRRRSATPYRGALRVPSSEVVPGTRAELIGGLRLRIAELDALAVASTLLAAAPLAAAWVCGLLRSSLAP